MSCYHVEVKQDGAWYVGRVLERGGVVTQGKSLDELTYMVRDAIVAMWGDGEAQLELIVSSNVKTKVGHRRRALAKS